MFIAGSRASKLTVSLLQARHSFGSDQVFIHTRSNDVDYESVRLDNDTSTTSVWLEFVGVLVSPQVPEPSPTYPTNNLQPFCEDNPCSRSDELQSSILHTSTNTYTVYFALPVHLRYQPPVKCGGDRRNVFVVEKLNHPLIFARTSSNIPQDFVAVAGQSRNVHWLYNQTKLGRTGNYAMYTAIYPPLDSYRLVGATASGVVFNISTGCTEDLDSVVFLTGLTLVLTTVAVMLFVCMTLQSRVCMCHDKLPPAI